MLYKKLQLFYKKLDKTRHILKHFYTKAIVLRYLQ